MKAMILAAGRGERMRPLSDRRPKPLLSAGGKPLLQWVVENLVREGFDELVVNTEWLGTQVEAWLGDGRQFGARVSYSPEPAGALGTGGGIRHALPLLGEHPFLVVNGDVWTDFPYARLRARAVQLAHLVLVDNPPQHLGGDFGLVDGFITNGSEQRRTFAGIGVYHPALFQDCESGVFPLAPLLRQAAQKGQVTGEYYDGNWRDIGTPSRLGELDRLLTS